MKPIQLGQTDNRAVMVDPLKLVDTRCLIQGNSGGGKSYLLRLIAEQSIGQVQTVILDAEGEFATLREKHDLLLIGDDGEIGTNIKAAGLLAQKLCELNVSAVIDLYDLKLPERRKFVRLFLESLMAVPRKLWHPMLIMLDEAHVFVPEKSAGDSEATAAVITLMAQGRKRGFAGILATQRLSKLHKDAAAECNNVMIGRTWLDVDQQRAASLLGMSNASKSQLRDLKPGQFYGFGPALNQNGVITFQAARAQTTHPEAGTRHQITPAAPSDAIRRIVGALAGLPEQAEEEARTLAEALATIQKLERELRAKPKPAVDQSVIDHAVREAEERMGRAVEAERQYLQQLASLTTKLEQIRLLAEVPDFTAPKMPTVVRPKPVAVPTQRGVMPSPSTYPPSNVILPNGERKILNVLAQHTRRTKVQLAILAEYSHKGGGFNNYLSALRTKGLIENNGDQIQITNAGLAALGGKWDPLPTGAALINYWLNRCSKCERAILEELCGKYPAVVPKEALASATGYEASGGGFNNALSKLRTLELIYGSKELKASGIFFED
ncbi:MAG: DUF87 domain-containing protein [Acidobacteriota bacterium]